MASNSRVRTARAGDILGRKPRRASVTEWIATEPTS